VDQKKAAVDEGIVPGGGAALPDTQVKQDGFVMTQGR